jgi:eukaryotic-like serine/threonine-protein kinase
MTSDAGASGDPLEVVVESFLARFRRGERPSLTEYAERYPELADQIRELFPALVEVEIVAPHVDTMTDAPDESATPAEGIPERLGDYRILRLVGSGGMGVVYEAERQSLRSRVALKVMHPRFRVDSGYLKRFRTEARSAAGLHHSNIVSVFDFGEQNGVCYYAMQFISGHGLDRVLVDVRRLRASIPIESGLVAANASTTTAGMAASLCTGRFTLGPAIEPELTLEETVRFDLTESPPAARSYPIRTIAQGTPGMNAADPSDAPASSLLSSPTETRYYREVARLGVQVADALGYAHNRGVLHRDIKPSNLLLDARGNIWVTDFGLAKIEEDENITQSRDLVGTLRYMAPERLRGISNRSGDIYALGATLYELLTLRSVFDAKDQASLLEQVLHAPPVRLRQIDARIPRDLETIVLKCLAKTPEERYVHAAEVGDELRRFVENRTILSRPTPAHERFWRWCRRNPLIAGLNALAATLTIVIAIVSTVAAYRNGWLAKELKARNVDANRNLVKAYTTEAEARRQSRRVGQRFETLAAIARAMELTPEVGIADEQRFRLRNEAIAAQALPDLRVAKEFNVPRARQNGFAVDRDFQRYAFRLEDGTLIVRRMSDDGDLMRLKGLPPASDSSKANFSPDGRYLAIMSGDQVIQVWDLDQRRLVLTDREIAFAIPINWSFRNDGRELAIGHRDLSVVIYDPPSGRVLRRWTEHPSSTGTLAFSPDGSRLAIQGKELDKVHILASDSGRLVTTLSHPSNADHFAWNPRRPNVLTTACWDGSICVWDVDTGQRMTSFKVKESGGVVVAYHPAGEMLFTRGWLHILRLHDSRTGRQLLSRPSTWCSALGFDSTGRWMGVEATLEKAIILEVAAAAECRSLVREPFQEDGYLGALAVDPANRRIVTTEPNTLLWDLPTGSVLASLPVSGGRAVFDTKGAIITAAPAVLRWPVAKAFDGTTTVGIPEILYREGTRDGIAITRDGRAVGAAMLDGAVVIDCEQPSQARWLGPHRDARYLAISGDGRWVATGSHSVREGMKLWNARTGALIHDFPSVSNECQAVWAFSPDSQWLAVLWDGWVLFDTSTWTPRVRLSSGPSGLAGLAFAPDMRSVAFCDNASTIILADVATGRELARFEDPEQSRPAWIAFTPDGSKLVMTLLDRPVIRVWDLRAIRHRLAEMRLDWDPQLLDNTSNTAQQPTAYPPIRMPVRVELGDLNSRLNRAAQRQTIAINEQTIAEATLRIKANPNDAQAHHERAHAFFNRGRLAEANDDFSVALQAMPKNPHLLFSRAEVLVQLGRLEDALADCESVVRGKPPENERKAWSRLCNNVAWWLASAPAHSVDPGRVVKLARSAIDLDPSDANNQNTLGVALYRAGRFDDAVPALERSLAASAGRSDAFDLYFLAMVRHRLRDPARARVDYDRAIRWHNAHSDLPATWSRELRAFRAEAERLLFDAVFPTKPFAR